MLALSISNGADAAAPRVADAKLCIDRDAPPVPSLAQVKRGELTAAYFTGSTCTAEITLDALY